MTGESGLCMPYASNTDNSGIVEIATAVNDAFEAITEAAGQNRAISNASNRVFTGLRDLDDAIEGILPGELVIVTGKTGVGKSALALNAALNAAKQGARVLIFSPSERVIGVTTRLLASEGRVALRKLIQGSICADDWASIADASNSVARLDIRICCNPKPSAEEVAETARRECQNAEKALVVFDSLEWMTSEEDKRSWSYIAGWAAHQLKMIARESGLCVLATMSPAPESDPVKTWNEAAKPQDCLLSLMGAEYAADSVLLIDRSTTTRRKENDALTSDERIAHLILAKSRRTPTTTVTLAYIPQWYCFFDYADDTSQPYKRHDDRVGDIALGLGWDRQRVVDALNDLYDEEEYSD